MNGTLRWVLLLITVLAFGCGSSSSTTSEGSTGSEEPIAENPNGADPSGCPPGGAPPVQSEDGPPPNCTVLYEGCCFTDTSLACQAAGCEAECPILESYPGRIASPCE